MKKRAGEAAGGAERTRRKPSRSQNPRPGTTARGATGAPQIVSRLHRPAWTHR